MVYHPEFRMAWATLCLIYYGDRKHSIRVVLSKCIQQYQGGSIVSMRSTLWFGVFPYFIYFFYLFIMYNFFCQLSVHGLSYVDHRIGVKGGCLLNLWSANQRPFIDNYRGSNSSIVFQQTQNIYSPRQDHVKGRVFLLSSNFF